MKKKVDLRELRDWFIKELKDVHESSEIEPMFNRLLEQEGLKPMDVIMQKIAELDFGEWQKNVELLKKGTPIQYVLGYEWFCDMKFLVNKNVLIPRPETEELVDWITKSELAKKEKLKVIDIGTGSGCIAISLKNKLPFVDVSATDISPQALAVALKNAQRLSADISFREDDILNSKLVDGEYDIIVSNPPYIPIDESAGIENQVKNFEPHQALFTDAKNPLQFYDAILGVAQNNLKQGGAIYFELHEDYAITLAKLVKRKSWEVELKKDIYGKNRMMKIKKG